MKRGAIARCQAHVMIAILDGVPSLEVEEFKTLKLDRLSVLGFEPEVV